MRTTILAAASILALAMGAAHAQQAPATGADPTVPPPMSSGAPERIANIPPAPNPLDREDISKLPGTDVYGIDGKKIGDVSTALMDPSTKKVDRLVVSSGGVLGIGMHYVVLPLAEFSWDSQKGVFKIAETGKDVAAMPEWNSD